MFFFNKKQIKKHVRKKEKKCHFFETKEASEPDSQKMQTLELPDREFYITMIKMLKSKEKSR